MTAGGDLPAAPRIRIRPIQVSGSRRPCHRPPFRKCSSIRSTMTTCRSPNGPRTAPSRLDPDGAGVKRPSPALLQYRGEHQAGERGAQVAVASAARLDENVLAVRGKIPSHVVHDQQKGVGSDLHGRLFYDG